MELNDFICHFIEKYKAIQEEILYYLDQEPDSNRISIRLIKCFIDQKVQEDKHELKVVLHLICKIANYHRRLQNFYDKLTQILIFFQSCMQKYYSNYEIFTFYCCV